MSDDLVDTLKVDDLFIGIIVYVNYTLNSIEITNNSVPGNANFTMFKKEFERFIKNYRSTEIEVDDKFGFKLYKIKDIDMVLFDMVQYFDDYNIRIKTT